MLNVLNVLMTQETDALFQAFEASGFQLRFVGGCVRDAILGVQAKDVDFCSDATPDEMRRVADASGFGFIATGVQHGTATLVVNGEPFEVTTLRIDVETDGRHAEVEFTRDFELDAARRDLTINAMSMDRQGVVYDYFGGRDDLRDRVVRFVGPARLRVEEDYLRILRYFRFAARFDATMDDDTLAMFGEDAVLNALNRVSVERFWLEMSKLLVMPARTRIVDAMFRTRINRALGVFRFDPVELTRSDDAVAALSTLVMASDLKSFLTFWKLSSDEASKLRFLVEQRSTPVTREVVEDWLVEGRVQRDWIASLLAIRDLDFSDTMDRWEVPVMPVRGQDLLDAGWTAGPEVGRAIRDMRARWFESRFTLTREELMA